MGLGSEDVRACVGYTCRCSQQPMLSFPRGFAEEWVGVHEMQSWRIDLSAIGLQPGAFSAAAEPVSLTTAYLPRFECDTHEGTAFPERSGEWTTTMTRRL